MVTQQIEKTMKKALTRFSELEGVKTNDIQMMIHTKNEELLPEYFYLVNFNPKLDENGQTKELDFNADILNIKMDLLNRQALASQFLKNYFKNIAEMENAKPQEIYLMITSTDDTAKELVVGLYNNSTELRKLSLGEVFGDD